MREQDGALETIEKSVGNLKEASKDMGQEISIQNGLLTDIEVGVEGTRDRMDNVRGRVIGFMKNSGTCRLWLFIFGALAMLLLILAYL